MSKIKKTIISILKNKTYEVRFIKRKQEYRFISNYVPSDYNKIVLCDNPPWFCHGLAFRMATYSDDNESLFQRLNGLLELAENIEGWRNESENTGKTWSKNYDEFFHFMWMLQCVEYFKDQGAKVEFPATPGKKSPDLKISFENDKELYVECYVYSKWWFVEAFVQDIIKLIDKNLSLERIYNIKQTTSREALESILEKLGEVTSESELDNARMEAAKKSPYIIYNKDGLKLLMEGEGEYQPNLNNAHGDPAFSAGVYIKEIIDHKNSENDLKNYRPNCLMVNSLGDDFQNLFFSNRVKNLNYEEEVIDSLILNACGIDEKLVDCPRRLCIAYRLG